VSSQWIISEGGLPITTEGGVILITEATPAQYQPLQTIIPSYPYQQYSDDPNIVAWFTAYNALAQAYLTWFNANPLGVYSLIFGQLLDWIGQGIYGISRPVFSSLTTSYNAGVNAFPVNTVAVNGNQYSQSGTATVANDDFYQRTLTWWLYAGDGGNAIASGRYFNIETLRKRVARFLYGANGTDVTWNQAQTVHILAGLAGSPPAPSLSSTPGGSLPGQTYGAQQTYVTPLGESLAGAASSLAVGANSELVANSPPWANGATGWNIYANIVTTSSPYLAGVNTMAVNSFPVNGTNQAPISPPTLQNQNPIPIGQPWVEPPSGLVAGPALPTTNTSNTPANLIITVPASAGAAAQYFKQAFQQGLLAFPFQLTGIVVIH
jgi:hypothetical protein